MSRSVIIDAVRFPLGEDDPGGGLHVMCEAGGLANATVVERLS